MPKLGDFIGAFLSDAAQARVRADLEAVKIAEAYSSHELLKHLPVPRFRLPDITVEFPVLVTAVEGGGGGISGPPFERPTAQELGQVVKQVLAQAKVSLPSGVRDKVATAVAQRANRIFEGSAQVLLGGAKVSGELAGAMVDALRLGIDDLDEANAKVEAVRSAAKASFRTLLLSKIAKSPALEVRVTASEVKAHANNDSVVRVRLTISEDAYEVIERDDGESFTLTPE